MTFLSLSKAQQRELLRAYEAGERGVFVSPYDWRLSPWRSLKDKRLVGCDHLNVVRADTRGRELVERWQRDQKAKADFERRVLEAPKS